MVKLALPRSGSRPLYHALEFGHSVRKHTQSEFCIGTALALRCTACLISGTGANLLGLYNGWLGWRKQLPQSRSRGGLLRFIVESRLRFNYTCSRRPTITIVRAQP